MDCLVCHDTTGIYKKWPTGCGHPTNQKMVMGAHKKKVLTIDRPDLKKALGRAKAKLSQTLEGGDEITIAPARAALAAVKRQVSEAAKASHAAQPYAVFPPNAKKKWDRAKKVQKLRFLAMDREGRLSKVARNVGKPSRRSCGTCHFFGGGGDGVKHGDLDSSLTNPPRELDVHMDAKGLNFACTSCHNTTAHDIAGRCYSQPHKGEYRLALPNDTGERMSCESCHSRAPHEVSKLNDHVDKVACQTCHIPRFARKLPTKMRWDWSTAGKFEGGEGVVKKDPKLRRPTYHFKKGSFVWARDVVPTYRWFNGKTSHLLLPDKVDATGVVALNQVHGRHDEANARIYPFKIHTGKQPYDPVNRTFIVPKLFGKKGTDAYWADFDWAKASAAGMKEAGAPFSGKVDFVETKMYWPISHMIAPKEQALACESCHSRSGRLAKLAGFYMPGRDRSKALDWLGLLSVIASLGVAGVHTVMRSHSRRGREQK